MPKSNNISKEWPTLPKNSSSTSSLMLKEKCSQFQMNQWKNERWNQFYDNEIQQSI